jgi:hypothetical protein
MRDVIAESLSVPNAQRALKDADKWKPKILHPRRWEKRPHHVFVEMVIAYIVGRIEACHRRSKQAHNASLASVGGSPSQITIGEFACIL